MVGNIERSETVHAILDAADLLFERYGYRKTTVEEIAQAAGIGKGSLYLHFRSKEDLAVDWLHRVHERIIEEMEAEVDGDAATVIRALLHRRVLIRFDLAERLSRSFVDVVGDLKGKMQAHRVAYQRREAEIFARVIDRGIDEGSFSPTNSKEAGFALVLSVSGLLPYHVSPQCLGTREEIVHQVDAVANLCLLGLIARPSTN